MAIKIIAEILLIVLSTTVISPLLTTVNYFAQVIYDTEKKMHILFTCWGRIGDEGQYQKTPYGTEEETCQEFSKIFKAKSGNEWSNINRYDSATFIFFPCVSRILLTRGSHIFRYSRNFADHFYSFESQPKKYRLVEAKYRKTNELPDVKFDLDSELPSKLNPYLQEIVKELVGKL